MKGSKEIRRQFIRFFEELDHTFVPSSPVVPVGDPTLLFANAGMNQFKDVFLGVGSRPYKRAANSQKCIRVSGKHNDLEQVGVDTYHHTFFEMLGNWSFGDYFKAEAIRWAWQLLTEVWKLPKERLFATVFGGDEAEGLECDEQAYQDWLRETDIKPDHVFRFGKKDNFWEMGTTGPCGPCSEIHIDLTADCSGAALVNADDPRVIEVWNLVFMQYNRDANGRLEPLPACHVDTGMGLERISAVLKHLEDISENRPVSISNYGTDLFVPILMQIEELTGHRYGQEASADGDRFDTCDLKSPTDIAFRVVADHVRALSFAISDGAMPSNEGRGYVLRRLLRRAARYGRNLGMHEPFIYKLVPTVAEVMGDDFEQVKSSAKFVAETIKAEEESFGRTLDRGIELFEQVAEKLRAGGEQVFPGDEAFRLYDTYGFPLDLTQLMAREGGFVVDTAGFDELMEQQRSRGRAAVRTAACGIDAELSAALPATDDTLKYEAPLVCEGKILGWLVDGRWVTTGELKCGAEVSLITDRTCFYGEQGGQVGDKGVIIAGEARFEVEDTQKANQATLHRGKVTAGTFSVGQTVTLQVDRRNRQNIMNNHTATHLLQWALRQVLGDHVRQEGSLVAPDYLRFDFTHPKALTSEELQQVESLVRDKIDERQPVTSKTMPIDEGLKLGVIALFDEKYGRTVRVIAIGTDDPEHLQRAFSKEFCGGTHVDNTAWIGDFLITREESIATGVRRITARTGRSLRELLHQRYHLTETLGQSLKVPAEQIPDRVQAIQEENRKLKKQLKEGPAVDLRSATQALLQQAQQIGPATVVVGELPDAPIQKLREQIDWLRKKAKPVVAVLANRGDEKVQLIAAVDDSLAKAGKVAADALVRELAAIVGGGGGGKAHLAQAGGKLPQKLPEALERAMELIRRQLE